MIGYLFDRKLSLFEVAGIMAATEQLRDGHWPALLCIFAILTIMVGLVEVSRR